jgi:ribonuclease BN (tRNA processing enzyme)
MIRRRHALAGLAALSLAPRLLGQPAARRDRVVLLGTKGGPTPGPYRAAPATLLMIGGRGFLVDCGNGTANQLAKAGIPLPAIDHVFVTHDHSDHVIDVGALAVLAWGSGLTHPLAIHGPAPIGQIVRDQIAAMAYDVAIREREEGRPPLAPLIRVDERTAPGLVLRTDIVTVTSALVDHYMVKPAFAYRFDMHGAGGARSVVISGDTTYSPALVQLAKGADLLIHEAMYLPAIRDMAAENAPTLYEHLIRSHSTTQQVGRVAQEAGVRKLVLSHLVPGNPAITDAMWLAGVREHYRGEAVVGRDLMEV